MINKIIGINCYLMLEIAYNNSVQASTGYSPYYINHGTHMVLPTTLTHNDTNIITNNDKVESIVAEIKNVLESVKTNLKHAQEHQKKYADMNRREEEFSVGDSVLLSTSDLIYTSGQKKLLHKQIGPYYVLEKVGKVAYKIELPKRLSRLHPVFHVSKLTRYYEDNDKFTTRPLQKSSSP